MRETEGHGGTHTHTAERERETEGGGDSLSYIVVTLETSHAERSPLN